MPGANHGDRTDRALGALLGGALGDALGMATQTFSRDEIAKAYGSVTGFVEPVQGHPVSHGLAAASVTDDTEQTLLLARQIIASPGAFDPRRWAEQLMAWEADVRARGLLDLLGPSTKRALEGLLRGEPIGVTGQFGETNGAAMRIAPVGIATPVEPLSTLVDEVEAVCLVTHNTGVAIASAAAVAAVISAGVDGARVDEVAALALAAAREGENRGHQHGGAGIAEGIALAMELAATVAPEAVCEALTGRLGTGVAALESVPTAFGLFMATGGDVWRTGLAAANMGGDTDTIGAIACGMAGACTGAAALPREPLAILTAVNELTLDDLVGDLLNVRGARARQIAGVVPA